MTPIELSIQKERERIVRELEAAIAVIEAPPRSSVEFYVHPSSVIGGIREAIRIVRGEA